MFGKEVVTPKGSFYDLEATLMDGSTKSMKDFKFSVLVVTNEPKSHEEILQFVSKYKGEDGKGADEKFHFMAKSSVNGRSTNEVFSFLKSKLPWTDGTKDVRWNFGKFLVSAEGLPYKRFGSKQAPDEMEDDIVELLTRLETGRGSSVGEASAAASNIAKDGEPKE
ncbi:hypothetical protein TrRE_jg5250 [Triparma retinervis]|uniref:Glutathione peroxidase n=1 Tax=Triparma retinervis TaxID=2557542 RepID=A0A9W6ZBL4_9STRA|nr:hypothetical protein TrRE_jg5250 [Triparma retinervis]